MPPERREYLEGSDPLDLGLREGGPNCEERLGRAASGNGVAKVDLGGASTFVVGLLQFCGAFSAGIVPCSISTQHTLEKADLLGD